MTINERIVGTTDAGNNIVAIDYGGGNVWWFIRVDNDLRGTHEAGRWIVQTEDCNGVYEAVGIDSYSTEQEARHLANLLVPDGQAIRVKQI